MNCFICEDLGFVFYEKEVHEIRYEFISYCTCEKGGQYAYDGRKQKDRPSKFYVPSVIQVFGADGVNKIKQKKQKNS